MMTQKPSNFGLGIMDFGFGIGLCEGHGHDYTEISVVVCGTEYSRSARLCHFGDNAGALDGADGIEHVIPVERHFDVAVLRHHRELFFRLALLFGAGGDQDQVAIALEADAVGGILGHDHGAADAIVKLVSLDGPLAGPLGGDDALPIGVGAGEKLGDDLGGAGIDAEAADAEADGDIVGVIEREALDGLEGALGDDGGDIGADPRLVELSDGEAVGIGGDEGEGGSVVIEEHSGEDLAVHILADRVDDGIDAIAQDAHFHGELAFSAVIGRLGKVLGVEGEHAVFACALLEEHSVQIEHGELDISIGELGDDIGKELGLDARGAFLVDHAGELSFDPHLAVAAQDLDGAAERFEFEVLEDVLG